MLKDRYFPVLDYGFIALQDWMGDDEAIEDMARTSYGKETRKVSDRRNLLRYLMRHAHTSPFERVEFVFHIGMPIFTHRQLVRHRTCSMNETSGRYSVVPTLFYTPETLSKQSEFNKQGRDSAIDEEMQKLIESARTPIRHAISEFYRLNLGSDVARELARIDLPLSTYTTFKWKIDLHNLFHFLRLRTDSHAQYEIRQYAQIMLKMVNVVCPIATEAFIDYQLTSVKFTNDELSLLTSNLCVDWINPTVQEKECVKERLLSAGYSSREVVEFWGKIQRKERPDLTLNIEQSKDAEYFRSLMESNQ